MSRILKHRPDLRIVVSSATLTAEKFVDFFGGPEKCGAITLDGRMHPVEVSYTKEPVSDYVRAAIDTVVGIHETVGDYNHLFSYPTNIT